jgi:PAS domain S-box-containing protein
MTRGMMAEKELHTAIQPKTHVLVLRNAEKTLVPLIRDGLNKNELCCCIGEDQTISAVKKTLRKNHSRKVEYIPLKKILGKNGFDPDKMTNLLLECVKKTQELELSGVRVVQEMTWVDRKVQGWKKYVAYEAQLDLLCSEYNVSCICCYDRKFSADILLSALKTHPFILMNGIVCSNFYYVLPEMLLEENSASSIEMYLSTIEEYQKLEKNLVERGLKRAKQFQTSEKKYQALIEHVPDVVYSLDNKGHFIELNPALMQILGYSREEIMGEHFSKVIHPDDVEKASSSFEELVKGKRGKTIGLQLKLITKEGKTKIGELNAKAIYSREGVFLRTEGIVRDITERKELEQKLEFLGRVVENVMEAVVVTDCEGKISYVNPAACSMFGYSRDELEGRLASILTSKNSPVSFEEILKNAQEKDWEGEMLAIRKEGERFPIWLRISALRNENGAVAALVSISRDIRREKEAEEKLQRYALLLEMKVREKTKGTETLLRTSYALRTTSEWKKGSEIITKGIVEGLGFDRATVFFLNEYDQVLECRGQQNISETLLKTRIPLSDDRYALVKCVTDKKPLLVKNALADSRIEAHLQEEAREFVWVPILFQSNVLGAIGADRKTSQNPIESEDVDMLELYANQIAEFIKRTRLIVEPEVEKQVSTPLQYDLELREVYIVEGDGPEKAYEIFVDLVKHGFKGFGICRMHPQKMREKYALEKTPVMWLSDIESKQLEHVGPQDIPKLVYLVAEFIKRAQPAVVIIEGVEYLIVHNDFKTVLKLLHTLSDYVATSQSILLLPVNPKALPAHEDVMLKRAFSTIPEL